MSDVPQPSASPEPRVLPQRALFDPFIGQHNQFEVHTFDAFLALGNVPSFNGYVFQEVDFRPLGATDFARRDWKGASFLGCQLPVPEDSLRAAGALVMANPQDLPFKPLRAFLYTQDELLSADSAIYKFYLASAKATASPALHASLFMSLHDFSIKDALLDYAEGKSFVSVMGGHAVERTTPLYAQSIALGRQLAHMGFVVVTGGGPGAMEAANLGAFLSVRPADDPVVAAALVAIAQPSVVQPAYLDDGPARAVWALAGAPAIWSPSLG